MSCFNKWDIGKCGCGGGPTGTLCGCSELPASLLFTWAVTPGNSYMQSGSCTLYWTSALPGYQGYAQVETGEASQPYTIQIICSQVQYGGWLFQMGNQGTLVCGSVPFGLTCPIGSWSPAPGSGGCYYNFTGFSTS